MRHLLTTESGIGSTVVPEFAKHLMDTSQMLERTQFRHTRHRAFCSVLPTLVCLVNHATLLSPSNALS